MAARDAELRAETGEDTPEGTATALEVAPAQ
jgi:acyl-CoA oxidase